MVVALASALGALGLAAFVHLRVAEASPTRRCHTTPVPVTRPQPLSQQRHGEDPDDRRWNPRLRHTPDLIGPGSHNGLLTCFGANLRFL